MLGVAAGVVDDEQLRAPAGAGKAEAGMAPSGLRVACYAEDGDVVAGVGDDGADVDGEFLDRSKVDFAVVAHFELGGLDAAQFAGAGDAVVVGQDAVARQQRGGAGGEALAAKGDFEPSDRAREAAQAGGFGIDGKLLEAGVAAQDALKTQGGGLVEGEVGAVPLGGWKRNGSARAGRLRASKRRKRRCRMVGLYEGGVCGDDGMGGGGVAMRLEEAVICRRFT